MKRLVIALTGPIAAGKNAASDALEKQGFACVDADSLVHLIIEEKQAEILGAFQPLARERGIDILRDGKIDRKALGSVLFENPEALALQESLIHPEAEKKTLSFLDAHKNQPCAVNATLLYKTPALLSQCVRVLYIDAPKITRFFRIRQRNSLPPKQIFQRIQSQSQLFSQYTAAHADIYKVWNVGNLRSLERKIGKFLIECKKRGYEWNKDESCG